MSLNAIVGVLYQSQSKGSVRLCLIAIADNAGEEGVGFPGIPHIAKKMGDVSPDTARRAMRAAVKLGELEIAWSGGRRMGNVYWVKSGLPPDAPTPLDFQDALALSAERIAAGKVVVPAMFADVDAAELADDELDGKSSATPCKIGGGQNDVDPLQSSEGSVNQTPPYPDADPSRDLGPDPSGGCDPNLKEPLEPRCARETRRVDVRGVSVRADCEALFEEAAAVVINRHGESWWAAWMVSASIAPPLKPDAPWRFELKSRLAVSKVRDVAGAMFEQLLGRIEYTHRARRAPSTAGQAASPRKPTRRERPTL